nr:hypothetical protein [Tanacetum cinerariifolium]
MAALQYKAKHNKGSYLLKPTRSDDYHNIIDFLRSSHIRTPYTITEDLVRSRLQLADDGGVADLPILEIYSGMDNLGYVTEGKLTFFKNKFSPQWRFLVHTLLHCLSAKFESWDQFGSPIAIALICLSDGSRFNWSNYIFRGMGTLCDFYLLCFFKLKQVKVQRPQSSDPVALVLKHDHSSDQHKTDAGSFPIREDAPLGGDFYTSPIRSSHAPPTGQPSGGPKNPIRLTALSSIVSTLVQKVHSLEAELHDHKKLFKDVVGKFRCLRALANDAVAVDSDIPSSSTSQILAASPCAPTAVPPTVPADSPKVPTAVLTDSPNVPAGVSSKGKSPMVEEDIPITARTFRERADEQRKRQQEVLKSAMYYNESDWLNIRAQVEASASLSKTVLGDDVSEDNFPARIAALIKQKRQALAEQLFKVRQNQPLTSVQQKAYMHQYVKNQSSAIYNTSWTMAYVKSFSDEQLKQEFEKIREHIYKPKSTLPTLDLDAPAQTFLKVVVDEDSDDEDSIDEVDR